MDFYKMVIEQVAAPFEEYREGTEEVVRRAIEWLDRDAALSITITKVNEATYIRNTRPGE